MTDSAKYLIHAAIAADGVVERSDVVGAVYGQTEGLLGEELDLRRLQESSKLGRIDVQIETSGGQSVGEITIATSLDRVETATLAAALETIDRVGPCRATVEVTELEDVRAAKRRQVIDRAERLLVDEFEQTTSDAIIDEVRRRVATADVTTYEGLPAGPRVADGDAIVVVEGRADVQAVLAAGVKNAIAVEGTDVPETVATLTEDRTTTAFLDGDRGGELILRELFQVGDVDQVAFAPTGRSVEDLSRSEILESLRGTVAVDSIDDAATARDLVDAARARAAGDVDARELDAGADSIGADAVDAAAADPDAVEGAAADADADGASTADANVAVADVVDGEAAADEVTDPDAAAADADALGPDSAGGDAAGEAVTPDSVDVPDEARTDAEPDEEADGIAMSDAGTAVEQTSRATDGAAVDVAESGDETHTDGGTQAAAPTEGVDAAPAADGASAEADAASAVDGASAEADAASAVDGAPAVDASASEQQAPDDPRTIHEHVEAVDGTEQARLLDDDGRAIETIPATDVFETLKAAPSVPAAIVLDAELQQRLLDLAAQRGVREVVAASLGSFTKRPTDVRVRTIEQLQVE